MKILQTLIIALSLTAALPAKAHYVWIERDGATARVHFGEYEEGVRERSPGRLDDIGTPILKQAGTPLTGAQRTADGWVYRISGNGSLIAEVGEHPIRDWRAQGIGIVKPVFFARHADNPTAVSPETTLDAVPGGKPGEFVVYFRQKPLAGSKVVFYAPNGWSREGKTDESGRVHFALPWRGQYILEATHRAEGKGQEKGTDYEATRYRATLSYQHDHGEVTFRPEAGHSH
jgi:hypothetical protein